MIPKGIDDKYEVVKTLQKTAASVVVLVKHRAIGDIRVLKAIQESHPDATNILSEANLLSGINSPQVPTIYDVGQLEGWYYLIEEYVKGESLQSILLNNQKISKEKILQITIGLCEIFETLHQSGEEAVLYRDLKPEHVMVFENQIRLIDFGIAVKKSKLDKTKPYGSIQWAAPEQIAGTVLDERSDIFGIGRIMQELKQKYEGSGALKYSHIAKLATEENPDNRYNSVSELKRAVMDIEKDSKQSYEREKKHLNMKIAVISLDKSVGCTHISIMLNRYLNEKKAKSIYVDKTDDKNVVMMSRNMENTRIKQGVLYHDSFAGVMEYGPAIEKNEIPPFIEVQDCGILHEQSLLADRIIVVVSCSPWKNQIDYPAWISQENVIIVSNFSTRLETFYLSKEMKKRVYQYPVNSARMLSKKEKKVFDAIMKRENLIYGISEKKNR